VFVAVAGSGVVAGLKLRDSAEDSRLQKREVR
jgi:hypothetical protein